MLHRDSLLVGIARFGEEIEHRRIHTFDNALFDGNPRECPCESLGHGVHDMGYVGAKWMVIRLKNGFAMPHDHDAVDTQFASDELEHIRQPRRVHAVDFRLYRHGIRCILSEGNRAK